MREHSSRIAELIMANRPQFRRVAPCMPFRCRFGGCGNLRRALAERSSRHVADLGVMAIGGALHPIALLCALRDWGSWQSPGGPQPSAPLDALRNRGLWQFPCPARCVDWGCGRNRPAITPKTATCREERPVDAPPRLPQPPKRQRRSDPDCHNPNSRNAADSRIATTPFSTTPWRPGLPQPPNRQRAGLPFGSGTYRGVYGGAYYMRGGMQKGTPEGAP